MIRFIFTYTVFIFILTVFPVLRIFILTILFVFILIIFCAHNLNATSLLHIFSQTIFAAFLAIFSVSVSNFIWNNKQSLVPKEWSYTLSWTIISWLKWNEYVLESSFGEILLRQSPESYRYWENLLVSWYLSPVDRSRQRWLFVKNLSIPGVLSWDFDYDMWLWTKWYIWDFYYKNGLSLDKQSESGVQSNNISIFLHTRQKIKKRITSLYSDRSHQALLNWMLIWDISNMSKIDYQNFIDSSLVHLVAVSGGNIIILVIFLFYWLFFLPYKFRIVAILPCIILYGLLVWIDSSVFRAMIMWSLTLFALLFWRSSNTLRLMSLAWIVLLLIRPYALVYDLWFLLSFFALWWILYFQDITKPLMSWLPKLANTFFSEYVLSSIWASLWVLPILLFFIWSTNLVWFVANIFILPIVPLVMYGGVFTLAVWHSWLWWYAISFIEQLLNFIYWSSDFFAAHWVYLSSTSQSTRFVLFFLLCAAYVLIYKFFVFLRN